MKLMRGLVVCYAALASLCISGQPSQPSDNPPAIEFEQGGLRYQTLTRAGLTVMFAQVPSTIREYGMIQVAIVNGTKQPWTVKPGDFAYRSTAGLLINPAPARQVVEEFLRTAGRGDVVKLVTVYEQTLFGLARGSSTSGYEQRRRAAFAEVESTRLRAAAAASAIVFVPTKLAPGESTDGAIFFPNAGKPLGAGKLTVTAGGQVFEFDTYADPGDPNQPSRHTALPHGLREQY